MQGRISNEFASNLKFMPQDDGFFFNCSIVPSYRLTCDFADSSLSSLIPINYC